MPGEHGLFIGSEVIGEDESRIGDLAEVVGDYFRVDGDDEGERYWFRTAEVMTVEGNQTKMCFPKGDLGSHNSPSPESWRDRQVEGSAALEGQQEIQREEMLRRTAEQRAELRDDGVDAPGEGRTIGTPVEEELQHGSEEPRR